LSQYNFARLRGASVPDASSSSQTSAGDVNTSAVTGEDEMQIMDKMMRSYESELMNPIKGVLFGNLMTAMLIQVEDDDDFMVHA
jgi:hypothetical protein